MTLRIGCYVLTAKGGPPGEKKFTRTEAQIAASRANGAKLVVIEGESIDGWQALLLEPCHREFQPETELVTEIAAARWRLHRCWTMEPSLSDMEIAKQRQNLQFEPQDYESQHASAARALGQNMCLMDRYETRMRRSFERAVENLYQPRDRCKNRKFPNEPENSGE